MFPFLCMIEILLQICK